MRTMKWLLAALIALACGLVGVRADTLPCTVATLQRKAPEGTTITAAGLISPAGKIPAYCNVDSSVVTPGNTVKIRLALPVNWNGSL